jgi:hypothetical protein
MKRKLFLLIFMTFCFRMWCIDGDVFSDSINYVREVSEPVVWTPESSVLYGEARISLFTEYGKLFYIVNDTLGNAEPAEYRDGILLRGQNGKVTDYNVTALLERDDGRLEIYSRRYRIDRTDSQKMRRFGSSTPFDRQIKFSKDGEGRTVIGVKYLFDSNKFGADIRNRQVVFPLDYKQHSAKSYAHNITVAKGRHPVYMSLVRYETMTENNAVIECLTEQMGQTRPPQFGSLQWGQTFSENTAIRIKPHSSEDKIYYWIRDFSENDFIFAPPAITETNSWLPYDTPIRLKSAYRNGTIGLAAFSVGASGTASEVTGPFYLKVTNDSIDTQQLFKADDHNYARQIMLNGHSMQDYAILFDKVLLEFKDFPKDERFYFSFSDRDTIGKSGYIPCEGQYIFENKGKQPLELMLYNESGSQMSRIVVINQSMAMPTPRDFTGTETHLDASTNVVFYLPQTVVRYAASVNDDRPLNVTENSPIFRGIFKADETEGQTNTYRIRFASFDSDGQRTALSDLYTITVDKRQPSQSVVCSGVDLGIYHNEPVTMSLQPNGQGSSDTIYYRMSSDRDWQPYTAPITITPPDTGVYSVSIFAKAVSPAGIETINSVPFVIHFDRRALYVDNTLAECGNGTQKSPYNTLDAAFGTAKIKNMRIINVMNENSDCFVPYRIDSDIILQPSHADSVITLNLKNKAIGRKNLIWFNAADKKLFEMRNIRLIIDGCQQIFSADNAKIKLYNGEIIYNGGETFCLANAKQSMIGISGLKLDAFNLEQDYNGIIAEKSQLLVAGLHTSVTGQNMTLFTLKDSKNVMIADSEFNVSSDGDMTFISSAKSDLTLNGTIVTAIGKLHTSSLFDVKSGDVSISHSHFSVSGTGTFRSTVMNADKSAVTVESSSFALDNANNAVGFDQRTSDLTFAQSLLDIRECREYAYPFRSQNCALTISSSIIRTRSCDSSVTFSLTNSPFTGINNSVFSTGSPTSAYIFWITNKADLTSINSFYHCLNESETTFVYLNGTKSAEIRPILTANVISENVTLMQRFDGRSTDSFSQVYNDGNIFYGFESDFDLTNEEEFFVPARDSVLLQAGIDSAYSPLPLPETDYYGRIRNHHRSGIDIGAVQRSGYF